MKKTFAALLVAAALAPSASAGAPYAGMTPGQAKTAATTEAIQLGLAFGKLTPAKAAALRVQLETSPYRATRTTCRGGKQAWAVAFGDSTTPIYVGAGVSSTLTCKIA